MCSLELIFPITKQGSLNLPLHGKIRSRLSRFFQSMVFFAKIQYRISIKNCNISVSTPCLFPTISLAAPSDKWSTNSSSVTVQPNWTFLLDYRGISVVSTGLNQRTVNLFHFCTDYTSVAPPLQCASPSCPKLAYTPLLLYFRHLPMQTPSSWFPFVGLEKFPCSLYSQ